MSPGEMVVKWRYGARRISPPQRKICILMHWVPQNKSFLQLVDEREKKSGRPEYRRLYQGSARPLHERRKCLENTWRCMGAAFFFAYVFGCICKIRGYTVRQYWENFRGHVDG